MKKSVIFPILIFIVCFLSSCGNRTPSDKDLEQMIPNEVLNYMLDGMSYTSSVTDFEVERQQTNEKDCVADCLITLEDDNLIRTAHITMYLKYWDKGGWQLDQWEANATEDFAVVAGFDTNRFENAIMENGFEKESIMESAEVTNENNDLKCSVMIYNIEQKYSYLNVSGEIIAESQLIHSNSYPQEYIWSISLDATQLEYKWDVTGEWIINIPETYFYGEIGSIEGTVIITGMSKMEITSDTNEPFYRLSGSSIVYKAGQTYEHSLNQRSWALIKGESLNNMYLSFDRIFSFDVGFTDEHLRMCFFPDYAYVSIVATLSSGQRVESDRTYPVTKTSR